jgi:hypothetical protein
MRFKFTLARAYFRQKTAFKGKKTPLSDMGMGWCSDSTEHKPKKPGSLRPFWFWGGRNYWNLISRRSIDTMIGLSGFGLLSSPTRYTTRLVASLIPWYSL